MQLSANELAKLVNGSVEGDPEVFIDRPSRIEEGGKGSISFLGNDKYEDYVYSTTASALLVSRDFKPRQPVRATLIRVDHVYLAVAQLLEHFSKSTGAPEGVSSNAFIHPSARVGRNVAIGAFAVIEAEAEIGDGCVIFPQAYIGKSVRLGQGVTVYPGARILHDCQVGDRCTIHSNAVIGSDGFGFANDSNGRYQKIPQTGNVVLHDEVDIGAGTTIDRASIGSTVIHAGVKLDNLIQVGHNVEVGRNTVVAAQTGIAGSTKIGANCQIGGQVGFAGHIRVPDGTRIQGQSGIASSIEEPGQAFFGYPAIPYHDYIRSYAVFKKLPELYKRIHELEKQIKGESRRED